MNVDDPHSLPNTEKPNVFAIQPLDVEKKKGRYTLNKIKVTIWTGKLGTKESPRYDAAKLNTIT